MVIALDEQPHLIALIFYDTTHFYEIQRIKVKRHHFNCAMVVNEISPEVQNNKESFMVALFKVQMDEEICTVVQIVKQNSQKSQWNVIESSEITKSEN